MNFDRLAPHYDWMETVCGGLVQRARTAWLDELNGREHILSVGEGHGRFAAACVTQFPSANLTCVEASPRMLARARQHTGDPSPSVQWHCADVLDWQPDRTYDAIVTCFFLDCFSPEQLPAVIAKLAACAEEKAVWLVTDFAIPASGFARWRAQAVHALMYGFFRVFAGLPAKRLTPPDSLLQAQGFQLVGRREFSAGLLRADLWRRKR